MPPKGAEKPIFKDLTIAIAGQLGGQFTSENIERWTRLRAGRFSAEVDDTVTHLLCSPEEFKDKGSRVQQALKLGKACHIVSRDWFEDSITRKRRLPEKSFLLARAERKERAKRDREAKVAKGLKQAEKFVDTNLYRIFVDETGFSHMVTITRDGENPGVCQRHVLYLFESRSAPRLYWFVAKFFRRKGDSRPLFFRPSDSCGTFAREFGHFKAFFANKTGVSWDERLVQPPRTDKASFFCYKPPGET